MLSRPVLAGDREFLIDVYRQARHDELGVLGWPAQELERFIRMQFEFQQLHYARCWPQAEHSILLADGNAIGQWRVAREPQQIVLVDVALLGSFRGRGVGSELIARLCDEAALTRRPVRLSVRPENRARHLYRRLGFEEQSSDETCIRLAWHARTAAVSSV